MKHELERIQTEFKVLSRHLPGGTEKSHKDANHGNGSSGQDLNLGPPEYEAGTRPQLSAET
jgi:hypothetical protein